VTPPNTAASGKNRLASFVKETLELVVVTLALLIFIRWAFGEMRVIPSGSMEPTLQIEDRLFVEKVSGHLGMKIQRGEILVFYPPPSQMGGHDLRSDPLTLFTRWTGLPVAPYEIALIKRVIGMPGDHILIRGGKGVYINGELLSESQYIKQPPAYNLSVLGDIGGQTRTGEYIQPYADHAHGEIVVPPHHYFMMGDNRNNSSDSHVWGFMDDKRIIGRAVVLYWRPLWVRQLVPVQD